jgi:RHS repeat-associated protein
VQIQEYYVFGAKVPNRCWEAGEGYRYGFNGKENDDEVLTDAKFQDYGMRLYRPDLGRFVSVDPLAPEYPYYTPYQFAGNMPVWAIDLDGLEPAIRTTSEQIHGARSTAILTNDVNSLHEYADGTVIWKIDAHWVYSANNTSNPENDIFYYYSDKDQQWFEFYPPKQSDLDEMRIEADFEAVDNIALFFAVCLSAGEAVELYEAGVAIRVFYLAARRAEAKKLVDETIHWIWDAFPTIKKPGGGTSLGEVFEDMLSHTRYSSMERVGHLNRGYFKGFDFWEDGLAVSLKTTKAKSGFKDIYDNINDLSDILRSGAVRGRSVTSARLDIAVPKGYDTTLLDDVVKTAKQSGIDVKIFHVEDFID